MHTSVKKFIKEVRKEFPHKFRFRSVIEIGSHNINGSPRKYFWFCEYLGMDISSGKGVDVVCNILDYPFTHNYNVVISTEMLEHDKHWNLSLLKMYSILEVGGLMIITCAAPDRPEHGTKRTTPECSPDTTDYYRNITKEDFKRVLPEGLFKTYVIQYSRGMNDLQFYGIKKELPSPTSKEIYAELLKSKKQ